MRAHADAAGLSDSVIVNTCAVTAEAVRQAGQAIRKARRERPQAKIIVTGCAAQIDPSRFAAMDEVDHVIGNQEKLQAKTFMRFGVAGGERVVVNDIMSVRETASHLIEGFGVARPRLCADPERLRPPLHLLRHSLRPRAFALGAGGRGGGASASPRREGLCRDRADRRRHHRLWQGPSRRDVARQARALSAEARAGASAPQAVLDRLGRGRRGPACGDRRGGAADAASASVVAIGRRPHVEAHEAAARPRRLGPLLRHGPAASSRHGVRRRSHRGISHRNRCDVRELAQS